MQMLFGLLVCQWLGWSVLFDQISWLMSLCINNDPFVMRKNGIICKYNLFTSLVK